MAEYIEREALIKEISESTEPFNTGSAFRAINRQPAVDVAPVVHGRWISDKADILFHCSVCETQVSTDGDYDDLIWNYCPHCGARMDGDAQ